MPNGSRLSCGRLARRLKAVGRQSVPARAQHSVSLKAITARQLQALVRRRPIHDGGARRCGGCCCARARSVKSTRSASSATSWRTWRNSSRSSSSTGACPTGGAVALIRFAKARANGARTQNPPPKTRNSTNRSLKSEPIIVPRECWTPPNGPRLSCGRPAGRRRRGGQESAPARVKRLLGGSICGRALERVEDRRSLLGCLQPSTLGRRRSREIHGRANPNDAALGPVPAVAGPAPPRTAAGLDDLEIDGIGLREQSGPPRPRKQAQRGNVRRVSPVLTVVPLLADDELPEPMPERGIGLRTYLSGLAWRLRDQCWQGPNKRDGCS